MEIRHANLDDLERVVPLFDAYRSFYGQRSDLKRARRFLAGRLEQGESTILLAEPEGQLAGFAQLYPSFSSVRAAPILILNDLFVRPDHRSRGVGAALLAAAEDHGRRAGVAGLSLSTAIDNAPARRLYERHGWVLETRFLSYDRSLA